MFKKVFVLTMVAMFVMGSSVFASDLEDFVKGENAENPLDINIGVAKIIEREKGPDVRIQLDRQSAIDKITEGEYTVSLILEF